MLRRVSAFFLPVLLSAIAGAQSANLATDTPVGVFCSLSGQQRFAGVPAAIVVDQQLELEAVCAPPGLAGSGSAALVHGDRIVLLANASAGAAGEAGTARLSAQAESQSYVWTLPGPRIGKLTVDYYANVTPAGSATVAVAVDIDADGTVEFSRVGAALVSVEGAVNRPTGLRVRITVFGHVQARDGSCASSLECAWVASGGVPPVRVFPSDTGITLPRCGPTLWVADEPAGLQHRLDLRLRNAFANGSAVLFVGVQPAVIAVPGTPCFLETLPLLAMPVATDALGRAGWTAAVLGPIRNADVFVQAVAGDAALQSIAMSDTSRVSFVD